MMNLKNKKITLLLLAFILAFPILASAETLELTELLHLFKQQKERTVDFREERHAFYLDEPLKSSGRLQFSYPDKLYKFILEPESISQKIEGDELKIVNGKKTHTVNLADRPEFSIIFRALISLFSGNYSALKKDFKIKFSSQNSSWALKLSPHDSYVSSYVKSIEILGNKNKLSKTIITEANNDRSITDIYNHR